MVRIVDYMIVTANDTGTLMDKVRELLGSGYGWQPFGGISENGCQAMVKYEEDTGDHEL